MENSQEAEIQTLKLKFAIDSVNAQKKLYRAELADTLEKFKTDSEISAFPLVSCNVQLDLLHGILLDLFEVTIQDDIRELLQIKSLEAHRFITMTKTFMENYPFDGVEEDLEQKLKYKWKYEAALLHANFCDKLIKDYDTEFYQGNYPKEKENPFLAFTQFLPK